MTAEQLYEQYGLMPQLRTHQLRVAAIGETLADALACDTHAVTVACLCHDMANIIKADLSRFPEYISQDELPRWQRVKDEWIARYGRDEHHASLAIAADIGLSAHVITLIDGVGFSKLPATAAGNSYEQKIVEYADLRVGPHGILSLDDRLAEAKRRYGSQYEHIADAETRYQGYLDAAHEIERQIFSRTTMKPDELNDMTLASRIDALRGYELA